VGSCERDVLGPAGDFLDDLRGSDDLPRGLVHAPQAQMVPPLSTNSSISGRSAGMPSKCMSSA
jgi:hypothetical protein